MVTTAPADADTRRRVKPVVCYETSKLPDLDLKAMQAGLGGARTVDTVRVPPRDAACFEVPAGHYFRIVNPEGHQVGDLNLWSLANLDERFYSGKTRQLQASHITVGDHVWSNLPHLNPLATVVADSLAWYGIDEYGGSVHDVIGTRCDPYTNFRLRGEDYHQCCHSNLTRALAAHSGLALDAAEQHVHDVINVFMCTGFTLDTHQYFMKATPARAGDSITFFAHTPLLGGLSACPGGNCGSSHSDDATPCFPLDVEVLAPMQPVVTGTDTRLDGRYGGGHGAAAR
ncbi:MAG: urea carboxylase-associated family protein [Pseudomonadota bacterium]